MKRMMLFIFLFSSAIACEKDSDDLTPYLTARVVDFDLNCSTCIIDFPDDSLNVKKELGESPGNYYQAVNLIKGSYEIGQRLKVKIRKPKTEESLPCVTGYKEVFILDLEDYNDLVLKDTLFLSCQECLKVPENQIFFCFESVLNDSRCPIGAYCFWEGNAKTRFKFEKYNEKPVLFDLNTHKGFTNDTIVYVYKVTLLDLKPHPVLDHRIEQKDYKAKLLIVKE